MHPGPPKASKLVNTFAEMSQKLGVEPEAMFCILDVVRPEVQKIIKQKAQERKLKNKQSHKSAHQHGR